MSDHDQDGAGIWIGIDFGTTHSVAAVWDSNRGRPKVIRLQSAIADGSKHGRLVPTLLLLVQKDTAASSVLFQKMESYTSEAFDATNIVAVVGASVWVLFDAIDEETSDWTHEDVSAAMVANLKRALGNSLPSIPVTPLGMETEILVETNSLVHLFLTALQQESQQYMHRSMRKKKLLVPHSDSSCMEIHHVVLGVPCHWEQTRRRELEKLATIGPPIHRHHHQRLVSSTRFSSATTFAEPTAACVSNGLGLMSVTQPRTVLVLDVGGGTSDVTISVLSSDHSSVLVTTGAPIGGDDIDQAILNWFLKCQDLQEQNLTSTHHRWLLRSCQNSKEDLCTCWSHSKASSSVSVNISFQNRSEALNLSTFEILIQPFMARLQMVIEQALQKHASFCLENNESEKRIDEVVLIGGSSLILSVASMVKEMTGCSELCSVHPFSAVAQGNAIQAARLSSCVPIHEIQSALLTDVLPYSIGVLLPNNEYVPVLKQHASVPAKGSARFWLADIDQSGVTVPIVEWVEERPVEIRTFQFLLHKLSSGPVNHTLPTSRAIDIRLIYNEVGEIIVSVMDECDPEHQRKYRLLGEEQIARNETLPFSLLVLCLSLIVMYMAVKLSFHEVEVNDRI